MIDITTAIGHLPDDIEALDAYWRALPVEEREDYEYLFVPGNHEMFFNQLRYGLNASMAENKLPTECVAAVRKELEKPKKSKAITEKIEAVETATKLKNGMGVLSPYPTDLARCNPFLPVRYTKQIKLLDLTLVDGPWGAITYHGPALTMSHEDVLIVILALIFSCGKGRRVTDAATGRDSFVYTGSKIDVLRARGEANPNKSSYKDFDNLILDMTAATIVFKAKNSSAKSIDNLASYIEDKNGKVLIRINSHFVDAYEQRLITWVSLHERMQLNSLSGRALHRFISSHKNGVWCGSLDVLSNAINIPQTLPLYKKRGKIKKTVSEMVSIGILKKGSSVSGNIVKLFKAKTQSNRAKKMFYGQTPI